MSVRNRLAANAFFSALTLSILVLSFASRPVEAYLSPDLTRDGIIDMRDIVIAARSFGARPGDDLWRTEADFSKDGEINMEDLIFVAKFFGKLDAPVLGSVTPEATTVTLQPSESVDEKLEVAFSCIFDYYLGRLELETSEGFETWLTSVTPAEYTNVWTNAEAYAFETTITVPEGTLPGNYSFQIIARTSGGNSEETAIQEVAVEVTPKLVIPEVSFGTALTLASMVAALALYAALPKLTTKQ